MTVPAFEGLQDTDQAYKYVNPLYTNGFFHQGMDPLYLSRGHGLEFSLLNTVHPYGSQRDSLTAHCLLCSEQPTKFW